MKNLDGEKLWAYLENRFNVLGEKYDIEFKKAKTATNDELNAILHRMSACTEKRNIIIELKNDILGGRFDA